MYYLEFNERLEDLIRKEIDGDIRVTKYTEPPEGGTDCEGLLLCRETPLSVVLVDLSPATLYAYCERESWAALRTALLQTLTRAGFTKNTPHSIRDFEKLLKGSDRLLFAALREYRAKQAEKLSLPAYRVLTNKALFELCLRKPKNAEELLSVPGIGEQKMKAFGDEILSLIEKF